MSRSNPVTAMSMPSARIKRFATNMPNQSTRRNVLIVMRSLPKLVVGYAEVCFGGKLKAKGSLKCRICKLNTTSCIGGKCVGCLDVKCFYVKKKHVRKRKPKKHLGVQRKRQKT